jgi:hypothetical protein
MHGVGEVPFLRRFAQSKPETARRDSKNPGLTPCKNRARIAVPDQDRESPARDSGGSRHDGAIGVREGGEAAERRDNGPAGFDRSDLIAAIPDDGLIRREREASGRTAAQLAGFAEDQQTVGRRLDPGTGEAGGEWLSGVDAFRKATEPIHPDRPIVSGSTEKRGGEIVPRLEPFSQRERG